MKVSHLATASLLVFTILAAGAIAPEATAQPRSAEDYGNRPDDGYDNRGADDGYDNRGADDGYDNRGAGGYDNRGAGDDFGGAQQQIERMITPEYRRLGMRVERLPDGSLRLRLPSEVMFAYDSANISPGFAPTLRKIAGLMNRYPRTRARIIGHTDSVGSDRYNLDLSLQRADSVAAFLSAQGVNNRRLLTDGRGKQEPIASNATPEGRQMNRRVDIVILRPQRGGQRQN
jgi:outer membrane protein OmpA-like peptidoglycan-associated protein